MKKLMALAVAAVLLVSCLSACTSADNNAIDNYTPEVDYLVTEQGTFYFEEADGDTAILVNYNGKATRDDHVVIPAVFNDRVVTGIGDEAFYNLAAVVEVTIPDSVTHIGKYAFAACTELTAINLPAGTLTIDEYAFANCDKLASVKLGDKLVSIGDKAFWGCTSLVDIPLPATLQSIGAGSFWGCTALTSLEIPASVTAIGDLAYYNCTGLETIKLHNGITTLGGFIFVTEGSTLKDKIDLTGLEGAVLDYVNAIAEPETAPETEELDPEAPEA